MAEYRDADFTAVGAQVVALSVDEPIRTAGMRAQLELSFPVLCDVRREVVTDWGLLNTAEHGGIAYPAIFVLDGERTVRYRSLDRTASRVSTAAVMAFLRGGMQGSTEQPRRRAVWPGLKSWVTAIRSALRHGVRIPKA